MNCRTLGKTGAQVSEIGLGAWQLGSADWGVVDDSDALAILHRAVENGVTFFDTADVYGMGVSERVIGKFLRETGEPVHVATKLGRAYPEGHAWPEKFTLRQAREATQNSLRNLGLDSLFLQQWHCVPTEVLRDGEVLEHLETLKREGLIRNWGCSVESVEEAFLVMRHPSCAVLQVIFNIFRQKLVDELLPAAKANNVGILARVPLASGLLTGRFNAAHQFSANDHRNYNRDGAAFNVGETFAGVPFERGVEFAREIEKILAPRDGATMSQLALRWILDHDEVSCVIPGASRPEQVDSNAAAASLPPLGEDKHRGLRDLYQTEIAPAIRGAY